MGAGGLARSVFGSNALPAGVVVPYGGTAAPTGWLSCDGAAVSRTVYAPLFAAIGTTYGVGDGSTTFNLPDLRGRFPLGKAVSGTGSTLGGTGGALDHAHDAHAVTQPATHAGHAETLAGNTVGANTNVVTGETHGAHTGTAVADHAAANPPFQVVNFIVKT